MDDNHTQTHDIPPAMDYQAHEATYRGFMGMAKWSIIVIAIMLIALYFLINP